MLTVYASESESQTAVGSVLARFVVMEFRKPNQVV